MSYAHDTYTSSFTLTLLILIICLFNLSGLSRLAIETNWKRGKIPVYQQSSN